MGVSDAQRLAAGLLALAAILTTVVQAHEGTGTDEFPCDQGPFGLPGLQSAPSEIGAWGPVLDWPEQATHTVVLHTGKVLWWRGEAPLGVPSTTYLWDPVTGTTETRQLPASNIFCSGHTTLADGQVLVQGGTADPARQIDGHPETNLFDPQTESWSEASDTAFSRWYPTLTTLSDGRVLATAGLIFASPRSDATIPEIYDPETDTWLQLPGADLRQNLYPITFVLPNGHLVYSANFRDTLTLDIDTQTWTVVGDTAKAHVEGSGAMFLPGRVLRIGGGSVGLAAAEVLDMTAPSPTWREVAPMSYPRRRPDLVLLPDGTAIAIGGSVEGQASPECAMHAPEIWDPATETWRTVASHAKPRIYHSTAALLPDGRVLAAGGEDLHETGQETAEVYSPPYLFRGPRPTIGSAPTDVAYGSTFRLGTAQASSIASVALLRPASVTHNFDQSQRYVPLSFTSDATFLDVEAPVSGNVAPPGYYMLFILDEVGVPSVASWIRLSDTPGEDCQDGIDNDGDTLTDQADPDCICRDADGDGFADCLGVPGCDPAGRPCGDCDDGYDGSFPGNPESCDLRDNDCNGAVDEGFDGDGDGVTACGGDCADDDPERRPGLPEICDGLDTDCDPETPDCPVDADITFFFNGEGCASARCDSVSGFTLDPELEFSAGDTTAVFNSSGAVTSRAALFGGHGFESTRGYNQMRFSVVDEDLVASDQGTICAIVKNAGVPAQSGLRLLLIQSQSARSYVSLEFYTTDGFLVRYRDASSTFTNLHTGSWRGASTAAAMLLQLSYDATGTGPGLRLVVDDIERAVLGTPVPPLGAINEMRIGNSTRRSGSFHYDPFLVSARSDLDCWDLLAGQCSLNPTVPCIDDTHCPLGETCEGVAENYPDLAAPDLCPDDPDKSEPGVCGCGVPDQDADGDGEPDCLDCPDDDGDGYSAGFEEGCLIGDCDDQNPAVHPGATEIGCDAVDNDCDPATSDLIDADLDGVACDIDCDDQNPGVHPDATEIVCDGLDNDCSASTPDAVDADGDDYDCFSDCNDVDPEVNPRADELVCDGIDNDCDPATVDRVDADGDGAACDVDCDDADSTRRPGIDEVGCDGIDNDCNAATDDVLDADGDGDTCELDCDDGNPAVGPGMAEIPCDGIDNDCNEATADVAEEGCGPDPEVSFFFNGDACPAPTCTSTSGYELDPVREFSTGDSTGLLHSRGRVSTTAALFGSHGFEATTSYDQLRFAVEAEDLVPSAGGSICLVTRQAATPAAHGYRLLLAQAPSARSYLQLSFYGTRDLRFLYRDASETLHELRTTWRGADTADAMLIQLIWNSMTTGDGLRIVVDGVIRGRIPGSIPPLGAVEELRIGNSSSSAGAFHIDPFLVSRNPELDCWELLAGTCSADSAVRCIDDADCRGAGTCVGIVEGHDEIVP